MPKGAYLSIWVSSQLGTLSLLTATKVRVIDFSKSLVTIFTAVLVAALLAAAISCVNEDDLTTDQRAYQLSTQLMCPVCDGQTLDQSQAQLSLDMQEVVRSKIEEGESNAEIRDYFVERYGEVVLASPGAGGFNIVAWAMPVIIFVGGALIVGNAFVNMRRRRRNDGEGSEDSPTYESRLDDPEIDSELDEFLKRADREIAAAVGDASSTSRRRTGDGDQS